ncbi:MAG: hypothetical protein LBV72_00515 [Tannerella sp.]|jgi:hypothetical protein|nr:hypothetical protein [Tannerella sp.]
MNTLKLIAKGLKQDLLEINGHLAKKYVLWRQSLRLKLAMSLADMKQRATNKRYYIMTMEVPKGEKLVSINRDDLNRLKRKKWLPKNFSHLDLERESWYQTDLKRNNSLTKEEQAKAMKRYRKYLKKQINLK